MGSRTIANLHAKDPQPDFVDAIPISVYLPAGKVPIKAPGSAVFKDFVNLGISKHAASFAPVSSLDQGAPPPHSHGPLKAAARAVVSLGL